MAWVAGVFPLLPSAGCQARPPRSRAGLRDISSRWLHDGDVHEQAALACRVLRQNNVQDCTLDAPLAWSVPPGHMLLLKCSGLEVLTAPVCKYISATVVAVAEAGPFCAAYCVATKLVSHGAATCSHGTLCSMHTWQAPLPYRILEEEASAEASAELVVVHQRPLVSGCLQPSPALKHLRVQQCRRIWL